MHASRAHRRHIQQRQRRAACRALRARRAPSTLNSQPSTLSAAFTLIELLVALTILVILATLVITGFRPDESDRMSSSARTVQAYLEGARSRAIAMQQPVGVQFIISQNDPRVVDSMQYIASAGYITGTVDIVDSGGGNWIINNDVAGEWARLNVGGRILIEPGNRIEMPAGTGNWYVIDFDAPGMPVHPENDVLRIRGHFTPSFWNSSSSTYEASLPDTDTPADGIPNVSYRMELSPLALPNSDPVRLERGIVIDLDGSRIPWRPTPETSAYPARMGIMFDARGNLTGQVATAGLIHLYLTTSGDIELTRNLISNHPANGGPGPFAPWPIVPSDAPHTPKFEPRAVTIYSQTGQVAATQVDLTDTSAPAFQADAPFSYALRGKEASQ